MKYAVELRIPDIIHSQGGGPVTLALIASRIPSPSPETAYLARIMGLLARKNVFSAHQKGGETLYRLTPSSRWLLQGAGHLSLTPLVLLADHQTTVSPWHNLSDCIKDGGSIAFQIAHGCGYWDMESKNPEFNRTFRDAMACTDKFVMKAVVDAYKDGFERIERNLSIVTLRKKRSKKE